MRPRYGENFHFCPPAKVNTFSFYADLWTNAPKEGTTEVPNFPWKEPVPSFVPGDVIRKYFTDYVDKFGIRELIKVYHNVENVEFIEDSDMFQVTVKNVLTDEIITKGKRITDSR